MTLPCALDWCILQPITHSCSSALAALSTPPSSSLASLLIIHADRRELPRQPGMRKRSHYRWREICSHPPPFRCGDQRSLHCCRNQCHPPLLQSLPCRGPRHCCVSRVLSKIKMEALIIHTVVQYWHLDTTQASSMELSLSSPSQTEQKQTKPVSLHGLVPSTHLRLDAIVCASPTLYKRSSFSFVMHCKTSCSSLAASSSVWWSK